MVTVEITNFGTNGFDYAIDERQERTKRNPPIETVTSDRNKGAIFDVFLGAAVRFVCAKPFAAFFRYGKPDRPDDENRGADEPDYSRQVRAREVAPSKWVVTIRTDRNGLYAPLIVVYDGAKLLFDHGLWFEVHQWGT